MVLDNDNTANDEELARALSARFAAEAAGAFDATTTTHYSAAAAQRREQEAKDAAYAASLARQDSALAATVSTRGSLSTVPDEPPVVMAVPEPPEAAPSSRVLEEELRAAEAFGMSLSGYDDPEEAERKRAQEASDAEYAARLAEHESSNMATAAVVEGARLDETEMRRRKRRGWIGKGLSLLVAMAAGFLLFMFLRRSVPALDNFDPADWFGGDWESGFHNSGSKGRNNVWYSPPATKDFSGLQLTVYNNLDDKWQDLFEIVMEDWDAGRSGCGLLSHRRNERSVVSHNWRCSSCVQWGLRPNHLAGVKRVANLQWLHHLLRRQVERSYVACHEVGHGLGLGHTDEAMYNSDLGECMDYTVRPENNKRPGTANFELLERMYGNVDGTSDREELQEGGFNRVRRRRRASIEDPSSANRNWTWTKSGAWSTSRLVRSTTSETSAMASRCGERFYWSDSNLDKPTITFQ
ncbi:hypothetical protein ACHAXT_009509 [Thalassiosira profunda]